MNRPHYSFRAAHPSDWGALADNSGNPARFAADSIPTEPVGLDSDSAVLRYNSALPSERVKTIARKPRSPLTIAPIDDLQGYSRSVWDAPRRTAQFERRESQEVRNRRLFADDEFSNFAVAIVLVACCAFLALVLPGLN